MPYYQYKCVNEHLYEVNRPLKEVAIDIFCPECMEPMKQVYSPPLINLKGRGFYRNSK